MIYTTHVDICYSAVVSLYLITPFPQLVVATLCCLGLGHHHIGQSAQGSVDVLSLSESIARCLTLR